jgi:O-antigen/teichoic acid export membrane protein
VLATAISNIVLNLALIPFFGYIAAATTTIVSEIILIVVYDIVMRKHIGAIPLWYCLARPGGATLIMFVVLATLNWFFGVQNFFLNVLLGAVVYGVAVWLLQAVTKTDLRLVKKAFNRKA